MEAYALDVSDAQGRPMIRHPINVDDLLQREGAGGGRTATDLGNGVRVYLEELPPSRMLPRGYHEAPVEHATSDFEQHRNIAEMHAAAHQYGFDDGAHAPFAFGNVQQWYDVVQSVQRGGRELDSSAFIPPSTMQPSKGGPTSPKRAASPSRCVSVTGGVQPQHVSQAPPPAANRKEQWASYAPVIPGPPRDFKKLLVLDVTPDAKQRKFSPLPMAHHSCVMVEKGPSGSAHFVIFGGTNGKSDEAEWYEFSLVSANWRRVEVKRQAPPGCHSHACVALEQGQRLAIMGGVSYEGPAAVPEELLEEKPDALKRLSFICPKRTARSSSSSTVILDRLSSSQFHHGANAAAQPHLRSSSAGLAHNRNNHVSQLIPKLSEAHGVQLHASAVLRGGGGVSSPLDGSRRIKRRAFQSFAFDGDVASMRWRAVQPPVAVNVAAHTATVFGSVVYLFGGVNELLDVSDKLIAMNPSNFSGRILRAQEKAPCGRYYHSAVAYGHWILVFGGFDASNEPLNDLWAFDCVQETWEQLTTAGGTLPHRGGHAACVVGCRMIIVGGFETALDAEGAAPVRTVVEVTLVPSAKGYLVKTLPTQGAALPPIAFCTATACGDNASVFVFGGVTIKPKRKSPASAAKKATGSDEEDESYSDDFDEDHHDAGSPNAQHQGTGGGDSASALFSKFPVTNKAYILTFGESKNTTAKKKNDGPKLNHLGLVIDENELSPSFKAFVRKQEDFLLKRDAERKKIIRAQYLEESEGAEVSLYLTPEEVSSLINKCGVCCTAISSFEMKSLPGNVPERDVREKLVEESSGLMRQAKDVMISMRGHEGPKQVKSKGHRKKTGEKFEDHSAAKPFRRVVVMDLIHRTNKYMITLSKMNKSLKTVEWPEKATYIHFTHEIHRELIELVDLIKATLEKYINSRMESLITAEKKHKENMLKLKQVVAQIQHDKVFKKDKPDAQREHRKQVLARDDRKNREEAAAGEQGAKKRPKRRTASPGSKHAELPKPGSTFKELLIEISKDEAKQLMKRCDWVGKAATDFAWHCNNTMSFAQAVVPADSNSPQAPAMASQERVLKESDSARASAITLSNAIAHAVHHFRTILETDVNASPSAMENQRKTAPLTTSSVVTAKETHTQAITADATAVNPTAPPVVPALPKAVEQPQDPQKNIMLRLSSSRPLMDNQVSLQDLLHTIGRIRHNTWDTKDEGGPKQDEKAESLCRALFHRATNLLSRINSAFLMHKGARSPRKKVVRSDPLMMTSEAMQAKLKARRAAAIASKEQRLPSPVPALSSVSQPPASAGGVPPPPSTSHAPASAASWEVTGDSGKYPVQFAAPMPGRSVTDCSVRTMYASSAGPQPASSFSRPFEPMYQSFPTESPAADGATLSPSVEHHPIWIVHPHRYARPGAASAPPAAAPLVATATSGSFMAPVVAQPISVFQPAQPPSDVKPVLLPSAASGANVAQLPHAASHSQVAPSESTIPPPRSSTPPPSAQPDVKGPVPSSAAVVVAPSSTAAPTTAAVAPQPQAPSSAAATAKPLSDTVPPVSPVPSAPPAWLRAAREGSPPPITLPTTSTTSTAEVAKPPVPVSVASGPFNGGLGFLGTHASTEDYMAVMMPPAASVGFAAPDNITVPAKPAHNQARVQQPHAVAHHTAGPTPTTTDPKFRGKLTHGERMILKAREGNRH